MKKNTIKRALATAAAFLLAVTAGGGNPLTVKAAEPDGSKDIVITNTKNGEKYNIYKLLDLSVDDENAPTAYSYTLNQKWNGFWTTGAGKNYIDPQEIGGTTYVTWKDSKKDASDMEALGKAAAEYASTNSITGDADEQTASGTTVTFSNAKYGYYLITSTAGTAVTVVSVPGDDVTPTSVVEKNKDNSVDKQVKEGEEWADTNDAKVGDTVEFRSKVTIVKNAKNVVYHDTMDSGLTWSGISNVKVYSDEDLKTEVDSSFYTVTAGATESGETFTVTFNDPAYTYVNSKTDESTDYYIGYTATLNKDAVKTTTNSDSSTTSLVDQQNKAKVTYGNNGTTNEDSTTTKTHNFKVFKHAAGKTENLADAIFELQDSKGNVINLVKIDATNYRVADNTEKAGKASTHLGTNGTVATVANNTLVSNFVTVSSGEITIWGVDSGEKYKLHEVQAPKGYNTLTEDKTVNVDANNSTRIDVANQSGSLLPSTGGIGTTIFYIAGGILIIGAAVLLINRKKTNNA